MKRIFCYFSINLLLLLFAVSCSKEEDSPKLILNKNEIQYKIYDGEAMVISFGHKQEVKIPSTIESNGEIYPVTMIGSYACNEDVKTLYLPASIKMMMG